MFLHIAKTAGTSIVSQLASFRLPWLHIYSPVVCPATGERLGTARDRLKAFGSAIRHGEYRYVIGHFTQKDVIEAIGPSDRFRYATMLRNPVERIISQYNYLLTPSHWDYQDLRLRWPTLDAYLEAMTDTNEMTHYLELRRGEPVDELANRVLETYSFLGLTESYDASLQDLCHCLGQKPASPVHLNRGPSLVTRPRPDQISRIEAMNWQDIELYRRLRARPRRAAV